MQLVSNMVLLSRLKTGTTKQVFRISIIPLMNPYSVLMWVHKDPEPILPTLVQHFHNIIHILKVVFFGAFVFKSLPYERESQQIISPSSESRQMNVSTPILQLQRPASEVCLSIFCVLPEVFQEVGRVSWRGLGCTREVDTPQE